MKVGKILSLVLAVVIIFFIPVFLYAEEKNWEIRKYQTVRIDTDRTHKEDDTYLMRLALPIYHKVSEDLNINFELQPFAETRYHWDIEEWKRTEVGVEAGFHLTQWAYIGEGFHYAWLKGNDEDTPEFETRLEINMPFVLNSKGYKITLALIEEYTYAVEEGEGTRNEIAANFIIPVFKYLEFMCGWRHIDRIHDYDSDQIELSAVFIF